MRRNLKFLHMWINFTFHHMTDVEKSEISFIMCTIYGILVAFYAVLLQKVFFFAICAVFFLKIGWLQFTRCCVEKIFAKNSVRGEKMTNIRYGREDSLLWCMKSQGRCSSYRIRPPPVQHSVPECFLLQEIV